MLFPFIGVGAQVSVQFGLVETMKKTLRRNFADKNGNLGPEFSFLSGFVTGIPSAIIVVHF